MPTWAAFRRTAFLPKLIRYSVAMMCILAMTRAVNIPINRRLMTWNAAVPPSDLSTVWAPWERIHSIRTVLAIVAFAAEVIALSMYRIS